MVKFLPMVWAGLMRRPPRTALTVISITVAFVLLGLLKGYVDGFDAMVAEMDNRQIQVVNRTLPYYPLPFAYRAAIGELDGVLSVSPLSGFTSYYQVPRNQIQLRAVDAELLRVLEKTTIDLSPDAIAAFEESPHAIILGEDLVAEHGFEHGGQLPLIGGPQRVDGDSAWTFKVAGSWSPEATLPSRFAYIRYDHLNETRQFNKGMVWSFYVGVVDERLTARIGQEIDRAFYASAYPTRSISARESARAPLERLGNVEYFVYSVVGASMFAILFVTCGAMAQSAVQRTTELAVLRSIGFRNASLFGIITLEAVSICLAGAGVGMAIAGVLLPHLAINESNVGIPLAVYATAVGLALLVAGASVLVPALYVFRGSKAQALWRRAT